VADSQDHHYVTERLLLLFLPPANCCNMLSIVPGISAHPWHHCAAAQGLGIVACFAAAVEAILHEHKVSTLQQQSGQTYSTAGNHIEFT
jgi:hypothetical protein